MKILIKITETYMNVLIQHLNIIIYVVVSQLISF